MIVSTICEAKPWSQHDVPLTATRGRQWTVSDSAIDQPDRISDMRRKQAEEESSEIKSYWTYFLLETRATCLQRLHTQSLTSSLIGSLIVILNFSNYHFSFHSSEIDSIDYQTHINVLLYPSIVTSLYNQGTIVQINQIYSILHHLLSLICSY